MGGSRKGGGVRMVEEWKEEKGEPNGEGGLGRTEGKGGGAGSHVTQSLYRCAAVCDQEVQGVRRYC